MSRLLSKRLCHDVIVHDKAATDIGDDGLADNESILSISSDCFMILFVDGQDQHAKSGAFPLRFNVPEQCAAKTASLPRGINIELGQF